jgi:para-nitrobenzyl esterase
MGGKLGACHALDVPFVFRQLGSSEAEFLTRGRSPQSLGDMMSTAWAAFAGTGQPAAAGLPGWPAYGPGRRTMILDELPRLEADPRQELREFWVDEPAYEARPSPGQHAQT